MAQQTTCDRCGQLVADGSGEQVQFRARTLDVCGPCGRDVAGLGWVVDLAERNDQNRVVAGTRGRNGQRPPRHGRTVEAIEAGQSGGVKAPEPA